MSRRATMTADAVKSALEREAADDFVSLIEVTFPDTDTLRYCNQAVEHMLDADGFAVEDEHGVPVYGMYHKGRFYQFLPFELPNPEDASGKAPSSAITISGMSSVLISLLRTASGRASVRLLQVHTSDPDVVQTECGGFTLGDISGSQDSDTLTAPLAQDMLTEVGYPCDSYTPDRFPGMF